MDKVSYIVTNSHENMRNYRNINYHCYKSGSFIELVETKKSFCKENITRFYPSEELWSTKTLKSLGHIQTGDFDSLERYVCKVTLSNLKEKTNYKYRVVIDDYYSNEYYFTTETNDNFTFLAITDCQHGRNIRTHEFLEMVVRNYPNIEFTVCSGDMVDMAGDEGIWDWLLNNQVWRYLPLNPGIGDHEYWDNYENRHLNKSYDYPEIYNHFFNNPKNGAEKVINSSYYYIYNKVMFVYLNNGSGRRYTDFFQEERFTSQLSWFEEIIQKEKGNYNFLIVIMHKSMYGDGMVTANDNLKMKSYFLKLFDKYQVDLVISGHDHEYSRTKTLYNDEISNQNKGTVYLDGGCTGTKWREIGNTLDYKEKYEKIFTQENKYAIGTIINVTSEKLELTVIDKDDNVYDKFMIYKKA